MIMKKIFNGNKYQRTYINGSLKNERTTLYNVQDTKGNYKNCDWFNLRRLVITQYNDIAHVLLTWKNLLSDLSIVILLFGLLFYGNLFILSSFYILSILCYITSLIIKNILNKRIKDYDFALTLIVGEIKQRFGLELDK